MNSMVTSVPCVGLGLWLGVEYSIKPFCWSEGSHISALCTSATSHTQV